MLEDEPQSFKESMSSPEAPYWKEAINDEVESILQNHTWELVDLPPGSKPLGYKWIFKKKMKVEGSIDKYKARLVIKGYKQKEGLDYFDTYSRVTRISSIRMLIAIAVVTPQTRGSVDYPLTRGIQVDVGLPDATSENRAESPLYGELYPITNLHIPVPNSAIYPIYPIYPIT